MKAVRYSFDTYVLDAAARELRHADQPVAIPPKSLECLAYLLQHSGRAVGRDELIAVVWGRVDANDSLLTQTIWRARRAIGDDGGQRLRTVPRFGYRWTAPVRVESSASPQVEAGDVASAEADAPAEDPPALLQDVDDASLGPRAGGRRGRLVAVTALLAVFAVAAIVATLRNASPVAAKTPSLIVVLPVSVTDADADSAWIRLGAMDYLSTRLRAARLNVLPSERVVAIAGPADRAGPGADERNRVTTLTNAEYLIVPRATQVEGNWRFAIEAYRDGRARTYRAEAASPLSAADRVAALFLADTGRAVVVPSSPDAIDETLQRFDAAMLEGDLDKARGLVEQTPAAAREDPRLQIRLGRLEFRRGNLDAAEAAFAPLAVSADVPAPLRALAELGLGGVAIRRHRFDDAEHRYTTALTALGPNGDANLIGRAYSERATAQGNLGRVDLAVADIGRARSELERSGDPLGLATLDLNGALIEHQRGHYAEATAMFDRAIVAYERFGIDDLLVTTLAGKTVTQLAVLDNGSAAASGTRAWSLLPKLRDRLLIEFMGVQHVRALRATGRLAEATRTLDWFDATPAGADGSPARDPDPAFAVLRAEVLVDQGKGALALQLKDDILRRFERAPAGSCSDVVPTAAIALTDAALQSRNADAATPLLAKLAEFASSPRDPEWLFAEELTQARLLAAKGNADADRHFSAALAYADSAGEPSRIVVAGAAYAGFVAARQDRSRAVALLARLQPYVDKDYEAARAAALLFALVGDAAGAARAETSAKALAGERAAARR